MHIFLCSLFIIGTACYLDPCTVQRRTGHASGLVSRVNQMLALYTIFLKLVLSVIEFIATGKMYKPQVDYVFY